MNSSYSITLRVKVGPSTKSGVPGNFVRTAARFWNRFQVATVLVLTIQETQFGSISPYSYGYVPRVRQILVVKPIPSNANWQQTLIKQRSRPHSSSNACAISPCNRLVASPCCQLNVGPNTRKRSKRPSLAARQSIQYECLVLVKSLS